MADKTVVPANVQGSANVNKSSGVAGSNISAGQVLYRDTTVTPNVLRPAQASANPIQSTIVGVAMNSAAAGQPVNYAITDTSFAPGFATNVGETLYLSENAGNVCPYTDLTTGDQPVIVYLGAGTATSFLNITAAGVKK